jgi:hypothetical protein
MYLIHWFIVCDVINIANSLIIVAETGLGTLSIVPRDATDY